MANVLYLVHRLPYPPDKGDKVRSFHILRHLCEQHRVLLGTFVDDRADDRHADEMKRWCAVAHLVRLDPAWARLRAMTGLFSGQSLTRCYFQDRSMRRWVEGIRLARAADIVIASSSSMAPYISAFSVPALMDFIDVDSAKWAAYAEASAGPRRWIYRREARRLAALERAAAGQATRSFFVTQREVDLFRTGAPQLADRVQVLRNGVDTHYFAPDASRVCPFDPDELPIVFTGTMNYPPNVDAVTWFAREVMPALRHALPRARFTVVGRYPTAAVRALEGPAVRVTGEVDDVRPWLQHAAVVVVPMRIVRGVQNKLLQALAMACPVVAARECADALGIARSNAIEVATSAAEYLKTVMDLAREPARARRMGHDARRLAVQHLGWAGSLAPLDSAIDRFAASAQ